MLMEREIVESWLTYIPQFPGPAQPESPSHAAAPDCSKEPANLSCSCRFETQGISVGPLVSGSVSDVRLPTPPN